MPLNDISKVRNKLFGICCLEDGEKVRVKAQWNARYSERTAFWIEADASSTGTQILEEICEKISEQGIFNMHGESCIVAFFLDLRKQMDPVYQKMLWNISDALANVLGCNIMLVMQFGFVGKMGMCSSETKRENAKNVVKANSERSAAVQHRLCLVGEPTLNSDGGHNWKAVIVFLDALRRNGSPTSMLPMTDDGIANNDIGFLRYGEYDKKLFDDLLQEKNILLDRLGTGGGTDLRNLVENERSELMDSVNKRFAFHGAMHPQHPEMIIEDNFLGLKKKSAAKGKNREYTRAQQETCTAVLLTGKRISQEISRLFEGKIKIARRTLEEMFKKSNAGIELRSDRITMESLLNGNTKTALCPNPPVLMYSENGCAEEINMYLTNLKTYEFNKGIAAYDQSIIAAYQQIWNEGFQHEKNQIQDRLDKVNLLIHSMKPAKEFCETIAFGGNPPESNFKPVAAAGSNVKFIMFRGEEMKSIVLQATDGSPIAVYEINELGGGINILDNAPLKTVQAVFLDCSNDALEQLMPEVIL